MELIINDRIRNRTVKFFNEVNLSLRYDSVASTFKFDFYFNPTNPELRDLSCIGHYHIATIRHNGKTLLTGNILSEEFQDSDEATLVSLSGGSLPGVLEDSNLTSSLQFTGFSLKDVVENVVKPFGIKVKYDQSILTDIESKYDRTDAKATQSVKDFLSELCSQKNIILSHDEYGALVLRRARPGVKPITEFVKTPASSVKLSFNGQGMHSSITVMEQSDFDSELQETKKQIDNPYVINTVIRPRVIVKDSGNKELDADSAAKNALAQELRNMQLVITTDRWNVNGSWFMPGTIISVKNPQVYLYKRTNWFVEQVDFIKNSEREEVTMTCVIPSVYDGSVPVYYFKGINLH